MYLVSWLRLSFFSNIPKRFNIIEKCFFVAVVTVLITAPSNKEGDEELRLLDMKWSCLKDKVEIIFSTVIKWRQQTEETFLVCLCFFSLEDLWAQYLVQWEYRVYNTAYWIAGKWTARSLCTIIRFLLSSANTVGDSAHICQDKNKVYLWLPQDTQTIYLRNQGCLDT